MSHVNPLIFKNYIYPPDGSRRLLQSSATTRLVYNSVDELNALTKEFVSQGMGIRNGSVKVIYPDLNLNTMYPVSEGNLCLVRNNHTLVVIVDSAAGETHSNELIFKNWLNLPGGTTRLHLSSATTRLVYTGADELNALATEFISREMGIHNAFITIYFPSISGYGVDPVTDGNLHLVKENHTLTVVIEPA